MNAIRDKKESKKSVIYKTYEAYSNCVLIFAIGFIIWRGVDIKTPKFIDIIYEIALSLDPIAVIKGGKALDPVDKVKRD